MPYRVKSTDVWHSLPGVVAAFQSIAAPSQLASYQNVSRGRLGTYTAAIGVAPTFSPATGWTFNGTTQYLNTGIVPETSAWSMFVSFANGITGGSRVLAGRQASGAPANQTRFNLVQYDSGNTLYANGNFLASAAVRTAGVLALVGLKGFYNGVAESFTLTGISGIQSLPLFLGCLNIASAPSLYFQGNIKAFFIASRTLSPAEVWLASQQMAYCEYNLAWNAWAPVRRYWFAPEVAAFNPAWARRTNTLLGGGVN